MFDVKSVVLHEILHGVGFLSSIDTQKKVIPINYDLLLKNKAGERLVEGNTFIGAFGQRVFIGSVRIYNPDEFNPGTSFSHVHESSRVMSGFHSPSHCKQELDTPSQHILNDLGYGCTVTTTKPALAIVLIVIVVVVGAVLAAVFCRRTTGRKKRIYEPLIHSDGTP
jgi:hypothetical protein